MSNAGAPLQIYLTSTPPLNLQNVVVAYVPRGHKEGARAPPGPDGKAQDAGRRDLAGAGQARSPGSEGCRNVRQRWSITPVHQASCVTPHILVWFLPPPPCRRGLRPL